jgi:PAS domain S-box-containing protein
MVTKHTEMMQELGEQYRPVFESSPDGVYLWLDEANKICSERLARMFGYSVDEWCAAESFLECFVVPEDQDSYSWNYHNRVSALAFPVTFRFRGKRKDGSTFAAETDMIPVAFRGHPIAYHFVRQVAE